MRALLTASLFLLLPVAAIASEDDDTYFRQNVQPLLVDQCIRCHGEKRQKGHLRLDSLAAVLAGGKHGPAAVPGKPDQSLIVTAVQYTDDDIQMPPKAQLPPEKIAVFVAWVKRGLPWPSDAALDATAAAPGPATAASPAPAPAPAPATTPAPSP